MDLLALAEVAELLGEPESAILTACRTFPEQVPVVGSGRGRRFPSIALDVLRLITDATAAGVPAAAITHLLETHHTAARNLANEILTAPGGIPAGFDREPASLDMDEFVERVQGVVSAEVLPLVQTVVSELGDTRAALEQIRTELQGTAQADDLELLRVEIRSLTAPETPEIISELTKMQAQLRPALHSLDEVKLAVEGLREEMAALRWQLDQREQLGQLTAELAELRKQVGRIDAVNVESTVTGQSDDEPLERATIVAEAVEPITTPEPGDIGDAGTQASSDDLDPAATGPPPPASNPPEPETPSAIITEFASRTPRRMGRTLFADEG